MNEKNISILFIGIANVRGACDIQGGRAAALVMDKGGFNGITTAAHEIAHT